MSIGLINTNNNFIAPTDRGFSILNAGWTCDADTFTICSGDLTALHSHNPLVVSFEEFTYSFTSNIVVNHSAGAGWDLQGRLGTTASRAWGSEMPLMLGVAFNNDPAAADYLKACFFVTRDFRFNGKLPALAGYIGKNGTAPVINEWFSVILLDSSMTTAGWINCPAFIVGWLPATIDNSATGNIDITVPSTTWPGGIGVLPHGLWFDVPIGQGNVTALRYFYSAGTIPEYVTNISKYSIQCGSGQFKHVYFFTGNVTLGAGANVLYLQTLFRKWYGYYSPLGSARVINSGGTARNFIGFTHYYWDTDRIEIQNQTTVVTTVSTLTCAMQDNATRTLSAYYNGFLRI